MSGITLQEAQRHLAIWLEAEREIAISQNYRIGTRTLTRADLGQVREQVKFWEKKVQQLDNRKGRNRIYRCVPRDL